MHTSHFWRFYHENDPRLVSIALKSPEWFKGREYPPLAPRLDMLPMEEEEYRQEYQAILDRLDPRQVYEHLGPEVDFIMLGAARPVLPPAPGGGVAGESLGGADSGAPPKL